MSDFTLKQGDTHTALEAVLRGPTGAVVNLTAATVRFYMRPKNSSIAKVSSAPAIVADAVNGKVWYVWLPADVDVVDVYNAEFKVTFADGKTETYPNGAYIEVDIKQSLA